MLELEKKHLKSYLKDKKKSKKINKTINKNKISFYKTFNYFVNEYYKNLKKEFSDSEIIKDCNIDDKVLIEIKEFLKSKNLAKLERETITINYETVEFLSRLIDNYKNIYLITPINVLTFFTSVLAILFGILDKSMLQWLTPLIIVAFSIFINIIIHNKIDKIQIKESR
ncbi:MAG: hypothetical protein HFH09_03335 [Bacilli bacterium]|jgi:hypothetical protein|nr:hypothetical protein [Bacilli bacterium]